MSPELVRSSETVRGHQIITVVEYTTGAVLMSVVDRRNLITEEVSLTEYVDAHEIYYDDDQGWMAFGKELPYLDSF